MPWTCILLRATDHARLALRRYAEGPCNASPNGVSIHDARALIGTAPVITHPDRETWEVVAPPQPPKTDPRWPTHCACGYVFHDEDEWQLSSHRLYERQDTHEHLTLHEVQPGMLWDAPWLLDMGWAGPDGRSLVLALPDGGQWTIDGPSSNGPGWTRTGEPPHITTRPSILSTRYHGWLTDGVLSDDLEGRTYA